MKFYAMHAYFIIVGAKIEKAGDLFTNMDEV